MIALLSRGVLEPLLLAPPFPALDEVELERLPSLFLPLPFSDEGFPVFLALFGWA